MHRQLPLPIAATAVLAAAGLAAAFEPPGERRPECADVEVGAMELSDPESTVIWLGRDVPFAYHSSRATARYTNAAGTEILTLAAHHGDVRNAVSEVDVQPLDELCRTCKVLAAVDEFVSGRGVQLGMARDEVERRLGAPHRVVEADGQVRLEYRLRKPEAAAFLEEYNVTGYYGTYTFQDGVLVQYAFGFEIP